MIVKKTFSSRERKWISLIIHCIFPLAGVSTDMYLPSLPAMCSYFSAPPALLQLTVTAFVIAMGLGQLIAGPISDAYGRKKPLIISLWMQVIAVLGILFSPSIAWVILFRLMQGFGSALMMVPARAIINDVFSGESLKKQFNYSTISFALAPIVAPFFGGYLQNSFGWFSNFVFMLIYFAVIILLLVFVYQETHTQQKKLLFKHFYQNYFVIIRHRHFMWNAFLVSILLGYFALFSVIGPFLIQTTLKHSPVFYGQVALWMGVAWFLGNLCNRILFRYGDIEKTTTALILIMIVSVIFVIIANGALRVINVSAPTFFLILLSGLIFPIYIGNCLAEFFDLSASANGLLFSMTWFFYGVYTMIAALLKTNSALPLSSVNLIISIAAIYVYFFHVRKLQ